MTNYDNDCYYLKIHRPLDKNTSNEYMPTNQWRYVCEALKQWDGSIQDREVDLWNLVDKLIKEAPSKADQ